MIDARSAPPNGPKVTTHSAREHLLALGRKHKGLWAAIDRLHADRSHEWSDHVYVPSREIQRWIQTTRFEPWNTFGLEGARVLSGRAAILGAWRMTQGIYRFDPDLFSAVVATPFDGDLPADALSGLPEWCIYVETPGLTVDRRGAPQTLYGFYATMDVIEAGKPELSLALDTHDTNIFTIPVPIRGTLRDALAWVAESPGAKATYSPSVVTRVWEQVPALARDLAPLVSLLLYLCSDEPDITQEGLAKTPVNPEPTSVRRGGRRIFPPDNPRCWDVGVRLGAALRKSFAREGDGHGDSTGRVLRPHVRRAHWHTFIRGPRHEPTAQTRVVRWLPPIPVGIESIDELPSVIRPVRP